MSEPRTRERTELYGPCPPTAPDTLVTSQLQSVLSAWGEKNFKDFPWRSPSQKWHGLIAEVLLQRTRVQNVIPVYQSLVERYPRPADLAAASISDIEQLIWPLGLRWRAPLLQQLAEALTEYGEAIPFATIDLRKLPGIGSYAAGAFLSFHMGIRSVIIDANIVRLVGRLTDCKVDAETRRKKWLIAYVDALTPSVDVRQFNYALLDFTREICARVPKCDICPIGPRYCAYRRRILKIAMGSNLHGAV